jgi:hypothetical protein
MPKRPDPNVRPFLHELEAIVDHLKERLPCCLNCAYFERGADVCTYQGNRISPPIEVVTFGCWAFEQDIPF